MRPPVPVAEVVHQVIADLLDTAPPLTPELRDRLAVLLNPPTR